MSEETQTPEYPDPVLWHVGLLSLLVFGICALSGVVGWAIQIGIVAGLYSLLGAYVARGTANGALIRVIIAFIPWVLVIAVILGDRLGHVYPLAAAAPLSLAIGARAVRAARRSHTAWVVGATSLVLPVLSVVLMINWLPYWFNRDLPGHSAGTILAVESPALRLVGDNGGRVGPESWQGKTVVLDFWTTNCGACYQSFPKFAQLSETFKDDDSVVTYAVHLLDSRTTPSDDRMEAQRRLDQRDFTFQVLYADESFAAVSEKFGFRGVPTMVVLDPDGGVRFVGRPQYSRLGVISNIYRIIEESKTERYF